MTVFLQSLGSEVAKAVTKPYSAPTDDDDTWSNIAAKEYKEYEANSKAQNALFLALNEDDTTRVIHCKSAYEIWEHLLVTMREHHKSRELKLISYVLNMKVLKYKKINLLMI